MALQLERRLINVEEYHLMAEAGILKPSDHVELINGEIIKMSPIGSRHAAVVDRISNFLKSVLKEQVIVRVQNPIITNERSEPEPDIALLKPRADYYAERHPAGKDVYLVIEVAESSVEFDKYIKAGLYAQALIPEYWIVDLASQLLEVRSEPENGMYKQTRILERKDQYVVQGFDVTVSVDQLF